MPRFSRKALLVLEKKIFKCFTIYGHGSHLAEWRETIRTNCEDPLCNLVKIAQVASEKTFKNYAHSYMYIAKVQG